MIGLRITLIEKGNLLIFGVSSLLLVIFCMLFLHQFLSPTERVDADILVVEGWLPKNNLLIALREFDTHAYKTILTVGSPIPEDSESGARDYANRARDILIKMGANEENIIALPSLTLKRHRTYQSVQAVKKWLDASNETHKGLNVFSIGAHAKKTHVLFSRFLSNQLPVGIISSKQTIYNPNFWWMSITGIKYTFVDFIAYFYAHFYKFD